MVKQLKTFGLGIALCASTLCAQAQSQPTPFVWEGANLYFLLVDRFNDGDSSNNLQFDRTKKTGVLRGFEGGDLKGITAKINQGYFTDLGINAIWMTPIVEQIHEGTDEGSGVTYGFHGYWTKDWTQLDPNFGTEADLHELIAAAHQKGIRIVLDAVINHTGPVTAKDPVWPADWVRTAPHCTYQNYQTTTACTLVKNLPDILTESDQAVELPAELIAKWKKEGRYEQEIAELDAFFARTAYPRAPKYYIIKWLTDYIREFGIDGYRADTVKHLEEEVWTEFNKECQLAFAEYKRNNPEKILDQNPFWTVGEVYNYGAHTGRIFDFGDKKVDYYAHGFHSLINFDFKGDANGTMGEILNKYDQVLHGDLKGLSVLNYTASHDDGSPFDKDRSRAMEAGTKLLLTPGISQLYYGDESARSLQIDGTEGDATLRSFMNWEELQHNPQKAAVLAHYQKLGQFRKNHPAIGAGTTIYREDSQQTYGRKYQKNDYQDVVVFALNQPEGKKTITVGTCFANGTKVRDAYSGKSCVVRKGKVRINSPYDIVLLEKR